MDTGLFRQWCSRELLEDFGYPVIFLYINGGDVKVLRSSTYDIRELLCIVVECHTILKILVFNTFFVKPTLYMVIGLSESLNVSAFSSP